MPEVASKHVSHLLTLGAVAMMPFQEELNGSFGSNYTTRQLMDKICRLRGVNPSLRVQELKRSHAFAGFMEKKEAGDVSKDTSLAPPAELKTESSIQEATFIT